MPNSIIEFFLMKTFLIINKLIMQPSVLSFEFIPKLKILRGIKFTDTGSAIISL